MRSPDRYRGFESAPVCGELLFPQNQQFATHRFLPKSTIRHGQVRGNQTVAGGSRLVYKVSWSGEPKPKSKVISFVESGEVGAIIFVVRVFLAMEKAKPLRFAGEGIGGQ